MLSWNDMIRLYIVKFADRIQKAVKPLQDHFGIDYFFHHRIDEKGKYMALGNHPDYVNHYVQKHIYLQDPLLRLPHHFNSGIYLKESFGSKEFQNTLTNAMEKSLKMDSGLVLIKKSDFYVECYGFFGNRATSCLHHLYFHEPQLLHSFADYFKNQLGNVLAHMSREANFLSNLKGPNFNHEPPSPFEMNESSRFAFLKAIDMHAMEEKIQSLSKRERQCLQLFIEGKSAKETGIILNLSTRTIEFYFENIKNKLSCSSKKEIQCLFKRAVNRPFFRII